MTCWSWVKRSKPVASCSVNTPIGCPSPSITITAPCARLWINPSASPTVLLGESVIGVSNTGWRRFTHPITPSSTSTGMSCGRTATPPRRATTSAMRRPATAVMFATTNGIVVPIPSGVVRSTPKRDPTADRLGTMNTSL